MKTQAYPLGSAAVNGSVPLAGRTRRKLRGWVRGFRVLGTDQGLIVLGSAHSDYARQLAQQVIAEATGLPILANAIDVS